MPESMCSECSSPRRVASASESSCTGQSRRPLSLAAHIPCRKHRTASGALLDALHRAPLSRPVRSSRALKEGRTAFSLGRRWTSTRSKRIPDRSLSANTVPQVSAKLWQAMSACFLANLLGSKRALWQKQLALKSTSCVWGSIKSDLVCESPAYTAYTVRRHSKRRAFRDSLPPSH